MWIGSEARLADQNVGRGVGKLDEQFGKYRGGQHGVGGEKSPVRGRIFWQAKEEEGTGMCFKKFDTSSLPVHLSPKNP